MELHGSAATVVLLRDGREGLETLLLERPRGRGSFAGAWVFPGGRVDPEDYAHGVPQDGSGSAAEAEQATAAAVRSAAVRETEEETGLRLEPSSLVPLSCWLPPAEVPRRYRTWFFLAPASTGEIRLSPDEHVDSAWLSPAEALARHRRGQMDLVTPTWVTLHHLLPFSGSADALGTCADALPETFVSRQLDSGAPDTTIVVWQDDADYPGGPRAGAAGRHRLVMAGRNWRYERSAEPAR